MKHIFEYLFSKKSDMDKLKPILYNIQGLPKHIKYKIFHNVSGTIPPSYSSIPGCTEISFTCEAPDVKKFIHSITPGDLSEFSQELINDINRILKRYVPGNCDLEKSKWVFCIASHQSSMPRVAQHYKNINTSRIKDNVDDFLQGYMRSHPKDLSKLTDIKIEYLFNEKIDELLKIMITFYYIF